MNARPTGRVRSLTRRLGYLRETLRIGEETSVLGTIDGRPAAVGRWIAQADGLGEIVGIVTLPEFRRRGAAATIVSALLRGVFASGREPRGSTPTTNRHVRFTRSWDFEPSAVC